MQCLTLPFVFLWNAGCSTYIRRTIYRIVLAFCGIAYGFYYMGATNDAQSCEVGSTTSTAGTAVGDLFADGFPVRPRLQHA